MSRLPNGWLELGCGSTFEQIPTSNIKVKSKDTLQEGKFPVVDQGASFIAGYVNDEDKVIELGAPVCVFGDHTRVVKWIDFSFVPGADGTKVLVPNDYLFPRFFYHQLKSLDVTDRGYSRHFKYLKESAFRVPPLNEQIRIANKLDSLLAKVDKAQARLKKIPPILKRFRQSILTAATSGELTREWRDRYQLQVNRNEIKQQHANYFSDNKRYKEPSEISDSVVSALHSVPDSWEWFRAEEICDLITKGTTPGKDKMGVGFEVPYIKVYNLKFDGSLDFSINPTFVEKLVHEKQLARSIVYPGDVLMNIVGPPLGKVSIVPDDYPEWNMNQAVSVFRPLGSVVNKYLSFCLLSSNLLDFVKMQAKATVGQFNLTLEICRNYPIPLPPIEEQKEIVSQVEALLTKADKVEKQYLDAKAKLDRLNQSILAKAFRGELVSQDPKDEPAEVLLKNIKSEMPKAKVKPKK